MLFYTFKWHLHMPFSFDVIICDLFTSLDLAFFHSFPLPYSVHSLDEHRVFPFFAFVNKALIILISISLYSLTINFLEHASSNLPYCQSFPK